MDSSQASSFIPKSPVSGTVNKRRTRKIYIFTYIIFIAFIGSLLSAGATWFFKYSVENKLDAMRVALNEEQSRFNQSDLERVNELYARMTEAKSLIANRVSVVAVLQAVEAVTVSSVNMDGLKYEKDAGDKLSLDLSALARDFNTALFQRQVLASNVVLAGSAIKDIQYDSVASSDTEGGGTGVSFTVVKTLVPTAVAPAVPVENESAPVAEVVVPVTASSTASSTATTAP